VQFINNTVHGMAAANTTDLLYSDSTQANRGRNDYLLFKDNLISVPANTSTSNDGGWGVGTVGLAGRWAAYSYDGNVIAPGNTTSNKPAGSPANVYATNESDIGWQRGTTHNYRLLHTSAYLYSGKGANIDALEAEQGKVSNARVRRIFNNSTLVSYYAPDPYACTVEHSTSATWGTGARQFDSGGDRMRNITLSGLAPDTLYHVRILCAVEQPVLKFRTNP
jgi:hypothetical protein